MCLDWTWFQFGETKSCAQWKITRARGICSEGEGLRDPAENVSVLTLIQVVKNIMDFLYSLDFFLVCVCKYVYVCFHVCACVYMYV